MSLESVTKDSLNLMLASFDKGLISEQLEIEHQDREKHKAAFYIKQHKDKVHNRMGDNSTVKPIIQLILPAMIPLVREWRRSQLTQYNQQVAYRLTTSLTAETLSFLTIRAALKATCGLEEELSLKVVANIVASDVYKELRYSSLRKVECEILSEYNLKAINKRVGENYKTAYMTKLESAVKAHDKSLITCTGWSPAKRQHVGIRLIELLIEASGLLTLRRDFDEGYYLRLADNWKERLIKHEQLLSEINPPTSPCIIPPKDWDDIYYGGYYSYATFPTKLLRLPNRYLKHYKGNVPISILQAVNRVQKTGWKINSKTLNVVNTIREWKNPPINDWPTAQPLEKLEAVDANYYKKERVRVSKRLNFEMVLKEANRFSKYSSIYFPYNLDWRGRMYPMSFFSPQGSDLMKGLLIFDKGKPIGEKGFYWLKLYGASLAGIKGSREDLEAWIADNHSNILSSAENPLECFWWCNLDDKPIQFLAFCFEYAGVCSEGFDYCSSIPIPLDGSCSGMQHSSAILRDKKGAAVVNLLPNSEPKDIYTIIANEVEKELIKQGTMGGVDTVEIVVDKETGELVEKINYAPKSIAKWWLDYGITRKVVKRPVMTLVYGATKYGFADQILEDTIEPAVLKNPAQFPSTKLAARYLAEIIWTVARNNVESAFLIMEFIQKVIRVVGTSKKKYKYQGKLLSWTTPDGLKIIQPYHKIECTTIRTTFHGVTFRLRIGDRNKGDNIDLLSAILGGPPNLTHSLDGCHLRMVVNASPEEISHLQLIHDSFGSHAADIDTLYYTIRKQLINLYKDRNILKDLLEEVKKELPEELHKELPEVPTLGDLDLNEIEHSKYAFSV